MVISLRMSMIVTGLDIVELFPFVWAGLDIKDIFPFLWVWLKHGWILWNYLDPDQTAPEETLASHWMSGKYRSFLWGLFWRKGSIFLSVSMIISGQDITDLFPSMNMVVHSWITGNYLSSVIMIISLSMSILLSGLDNYHGFISISVSIVISLCMSMVVTGLDIMELFPFL